MDIDPRREVECFSDRGSMMRRAAERVVERACNSIGRRGRFLLVLSGGSTPRPLYELLATSPFAARIECPILSTAINERFASRGEDEFADRLLSAMRFQFGGHEEKAP